MTVSTRRIEEGYCVPNFRCWWWWKTFDAPDPNLIFTNLLHFNPFQLSNNIGVVVQRTLYLIKQLRSYRTDCDATPGIPLLGQDAFTQVVNFRNGKADIHMLSGFQEILEGRIVATTHI